MNSEKTFFEKLLALDPPTGAAWRCLGCSVVLVGIVTASLLLSGCGVRTLPGMLVLAPPQGLPEAPRVEYKSVRLVMGPFHLTRVPKTWDIEITPHGSGLPHSELYDVYISGASPHGRMKFAVYPGQFITLQVQLSAYPFYEGTPAFTPAQLRRRYPSDHAVLIACSNLPPGDPAKGGKWLSPQEQEDCVLADVARDIGFRSVPARTKRGPLEIFSGGSLRQLDRAEDKMAIYRVVVFAGDSPTGVHLFGNFEGRRIESEDPWEAVHDLGIAAAHLIDGLEVITPLVQPSQEEIERAAEEEIEDLYWK